ncbi:MAG: hypothetical protein ACLRO0_05635 [Massilimicrobiota timonensis]
MKLSQQISMKSHAYQQGDIIIADSQTNGKGRNGRSFYSPKQKVFIFPLC